MLRFRTQTWLHSNRSRNDWLTVLHDHARLVQALTHPSFNNEQETGSGDYQRLEFLGDAVLGMLLAETFFARFPEADEGELSRYRAQLAEQGSLAGIARERGIGPFIRLGRGEEQTAGRDKDSILCDVLEALIAAVYLDGGLEAARNVVLGLFDDLLDAPWEQTAARDSKSELQEALSARGLERPNTGWPKSPARPMTASSGFWC